MKVKNITLLLIATSFLIFSCSKDDDPVQNTDPVVQADETPALTEAEFTEILAGTSNKTWTATSFKLATMSQTCRLDDAFIFNIDHTYIYNGGNDLCGDEDNAADKSGTWALDAENNLIIFDQNTNAEYEAVIKTASENELELSGSYLSLSVEGTYSN